MLSIVTAFHNCWLDFEQFVRHLHAHNAAGDFEVCAFHDDRVDDGSAAKLAALKAEFSNVKSVSKDKADAVSWIRSVLAARVGTWDADVLARLNANVDAYEAGTLFDEKEETLWLSAVARWNAAAALAESGNPLLFMPGDWLLGCAVSDLEQYVSANLDEGNFYGRLNLIELQVTNLGYEVIRDAEVAEVQRRNSMKNTHWTSHEAILRGLRRDYARWTVDLSDYLVAEPAKRTPFALDVSDFHTRVKTACEECVTYGRVPFEWAFHGVHLFARQTYDSIGGFTESAIEHWGPDRKMCKDGQVHFKAELPAHLAVVRTGNHRVAGGIQTQGQRVQCLGVDPKANDHPIPGMFRQRTLAERDQAYCLVAMKADLGLGV